MVIMVTAVDDNDLSGIIGIESHEGEVINVQYNTSADDEPGSFIPKAIFF